MRRPTKAPWSQGLRDDPRCPVRHFVIRAVPREELVRSSARAGKIGTKHEIGEHFRIAPQATFHLRRRHPEAGRCTSDHR